MKCPHCTTEIFDFRVPNAILYGDEHLLDESGYWSTFSSICPKCRNAIIWLKCSPKGNVNFSKNEIFRMVYPRAVSRAPLPAEVPDKFAGDYREACLVLADSLKASAALSRRCLQLVLLDAAKTKERDNLAKQIAEVLPTLPPYIRELLDALRAIGNFAAHPLKETHTGEIIEVEPGEAELLLDVLEMVFDFYFVQPAETKKKRDGINAKLAAAGKPPLK